MKKNYSKPVSTTVHIAPGSLLVGGSLTVSEYRRGSDITVGDSDDEDG